MMKSFGSVVSSEHSGWRWGVQMSGGRRRRQERAGRTDRAWHSAGTPGRTCDGDTGPHPLACPESRPRPRRGVEPSANWGLMGDVVRTLRQGWLTRNNHSGLHQTIAVKKRLIMNEHIFAKISSFQLIYLMQMWAKPRRNLMSPPKVLMPINKF